MVILEINSCLEFGGIKITDWIQSIGAAIAILAAIAGFYKLYQDMKDQQKQIDSLSILAEQSKEQTKQLALQVEQMNIANEIQEKRRMTHFNQRKHDIRPFFIIERMAGSKESNLTYTLKNKGDTAIIKEVKFVLEKNDELNYSEYYNKSIIFDENFTIFIKPMIDGSKRAVGCLNIKLSYSDKEGTYYYQNVSSLSDIYPSIDEPIEIIGIPDN